MCQLRAIHCDHADEWTNCIARCKRCVAMVIGRGRVQPLLPFRALRRIWLESCRGVSQRAQERVLCPFHVVTEPRVHRVVAVDRGQILQVDALARCRVVA